VPEFVERQVDENTLESLQEAVRLSPTNAVALARLALRFIEEKKPSPPAMLAEASRCMTRSLRLAPADPEVKLCQARLLAQTNTLAGLESALGRKPRSPALWLARGMLLERNNRRDEAVSAFSKTIELAGTGPAFARLRSEALRRRAALLQRSGRQDEPKPPVTAPPPKRP